MTDNFYDISVYLLMFLIVSLITYLLSLNIDQKYRSFFFYGLVFKMLLSLMLGLVFKFYYGWGDTLGFYKYGMIVRDVLDADFSQFSNIILKGNHYQYPELEHMLVSNRSFVFMKNLAATLSYFSFRSFLGIGLLVSIVSFSGCWFLYQRVVKLYPQAYRVLGILIFFIPSVIFWTSGLLKDSIVLACFTFFIGATIDLFKFKRKIVLSILIIILCYVTISRIKGYVADALLLSFLVFVFYNSILKISSRVTRSLLYFTMFFGIALVMVIFSSEISNYIQKALIDEFFSDAINKQHALNYFGRDTSSSYQIGLDLYNSTNISMLSMLSLFPIAVVTTLFRPFVWEANKAIVMISAIENLFILGFSVYILFKVGIINFFRIVTKDSFLTFLFIFVLIFAFAVGLATGNFGALSRYRTPGMALYFPLLYLVYYTYQKNKNEKRLYR